MKKGTKITKPIIRLENARLAAANKGLVFAVAVELLGPGRKASDEMISAGMLGLVEGSIRFDETRGVAYSSYVCDWIRAMMKIDYVRNLGPTKFGTTREERRIFYGLNKARAHLTQVYGSEGATDERLAARLGVSVETFLEIVSRIERRDFSLNSTFKDSVHVRRGLPSPEPSPEDVLAEKEKEAVCKALVERILAHLNEREREVVRRRFLTDEPETLSDIGQDFGVSRARVHQIEQRAMVKMRQLAAGVPLKELAAAASVRQLAAESTVP